jgi:phage terminase small subunit
LHGARRSRIRPEPVPLARPLTPPAYLPAEARPIWDEQAEQLDGLGIGRAIDSEALAAYCVLLARFRAVAVEAAEAVEDDRALRRLVQLGAEVRMWAREFGFTPAARQSLGGASGPRPAGGPGRLLG